MAAIDVTVETDIAAAPTDVAGVMFDAQREPEWMKAVTTVELIDPALEAGARVRRSGSFLGQTLTWTTEVETVHFPHVLALRILDGPFVGSVRYEIKRTGQGSHVRIRNVGEPTALGFLPAAMITAPMHSALTADLTRLKAIVEGGSGV